MTSVAAEPRAPLRPTRAGGAALASVATAAACLLALPQSPHAFVQALTAGLLVWLAALDLEFRLVPNRIVLPATAVVLTLTAVLEPSLAAEHALAAVGAGGLLLLAAMLRPGDLGMGDVKLGLLLGAMLGSSVVTAAMVGFGAVTLVGVALLARSGRSALKRRLPLAPFLALGAIVTLVAGAA